MISGQPAALIPPPPPNGPQVPPQPPPPNQIFFSSVPQGVPLSYVIHRLIEQSYSKLLQLSERYFSPLINQHTPLDNKFSVCSVPHAKIITHANVLLFCFTTLHKCNTTRHSLITHPLRIAPHQCTYST
jgi:hypothetical protein